MTAFLTKRRQGPVPSQLAAIMLAVCIVLLAGCANNKPLTTGSVATHTKPVADMNVMELSAAAARFGEAYEKNPQDRNTGLAYASILRMTGRDEQALAVMQQVAIHHPEDREVLAAYGKAQAAVGQFDMALKSIRRAQTPDRPDWKLISAEGAVLDQLERRDEARQLYRKALDLAPNEPSVLSNIGMSYLLTGDLKIAEQNLRKASGMPGADSRVRQNLALVVGLQGRFAEAETIARAELPKEQADANINYLRSLLAEDNTWAELAADDRDTAIAEN